MDDFLEQLIDQVEQDESAQPTRDALMENLYSALADPRLENSWGEGYIVNGIDAYTIICGGVAARAALLDYYLCEYQERLEEAMRSPDRTFGNGPAVMRKHGATRPSLTGLKPAATFYHRSVASRYPDRKRKFENTKAARAQGSGRFFVWGRWRMVKLLSGGAEVASSGQS